MTIEERDQVLCNIATTIEVFGLNAVHDCHAARVLSIPAGAEHLSKNYAESAVERCRKLITELAEYCDQLEAE